MTQSGFTLVETVVVITILAIIAAIAAPRFVDNQAFADRGYFEELADALKVAQKLAVGTGCPVRFVIDAGGYEARQQAGAAGRCAAGDTSWATPIVLADGTNLAGSAPAGTNVSPALTVVFGPLGSTDLAVNQTVTVGGWGLVIHAASGFIDVP